MKTKALSFVLTFALMVSLLGLGSGSVSAQSSTGSATSVSSSATASAGVAAPISSFDLDRSDDEIIQLNNLQIQSLGSGSLPTVITAVSNSGGSCQKYLSSGARTVCPLSPSYLYSIRVSSETILLQRDRARISFGQLQVGDKINVYGFRDSDTGNMDALILRDLSLPKQEKYIQLNSVQVVSGPSSTVPPATLVILRSDFPCYDYGIYGSSARVNMVCPMGFTTPASSGATANISIDARYFPQVKYLVQVNASTVLYNKNWGRISLSQIQVGDSVNIYGRLSADGVTLTALTLRDMSLPRAVQSNLDISTSSNLRTKVGTYFSAGFDVKGGNQPYEISAEGSDAIPGMSFTRTPCAPGRYCIQMIDPDSIYLAGTPTAGGIYTIRITASDSGYYPCPTDVPCPLNARLPQKITETFTLIVEPISTTGQAPVIESVGGSSVLKVGETGNFTVTARDPEGGPLTYSVRWGDEPVYLSPQASSIRMPDETKTTAGLTHSYSYPGTYTVTFTVTDNQGLATSTTLSVNVR